MKVSTHDNGRGRRILVPLGGCDHVLTDAAATELRDALARELGAAARDQLTDREAIAWATVYAVKRDMGKSVIEAVRLAALEVKNLRSAMDHAELLGGDDAARAMLVAMTGGGR